MVWLLVKISNEQKNPDSSFRAAAGFTYSVWIQFHFHFEFQANVTRMFKQNETIDDCYITHVCACILRYEQAFGVDNKYRLDFLAEIF